MKITTILPISRKKYLDKIIESLLSQTYQPDNLIVIYDGVDSDYLEVRNKIVELPYNVLFMMSNNTGIAHTIHERRQHIVNIHNQFREAIQDCDWIFSIEDDGVLTNNALELLLRTAYEEEYNGHRVGMVTGVELGRWGIPYVGAWKVDDVTNTTEITSLENMTPKNEHQEIDACGLYCALINAEYYKKHHFFTNNGLGPDVNLGLYLRQQGFKNYIDWEVPVTHLTLDRNKEIEIPATSESRVVTLKLLSGSTWGR